MFYFLGEHLIFTCISLCFGHLHPSFQLHILPFQQLPSPILGHGVFPALKGVLHSIEVIQAIRTRGAKPPGSQSCRCSAPAFLMFKARGVDLAGCFQPIQKIWSSNWIIPQVGVKILKKWNHHLVDLYLTMFWTKRPLKKAEKDVKRPCEKPTWLDNVPVCCSLHKNSLQLFGKMSTQVLKELLCPPIPAPPPKHIWDMVFLSGSAHSVPLFQTGAFCPPCTFV